MTPAGRRSGRELEGAERDGTRCPRGRGRRVHRRAVRGGRRRDWPAKAEPGRPVAGRSRGRRARPPVAGGGIERAGRGRALVAASAAIRRTAGRTPAPTPLAKPAPAASGPSGAPRSQTRARASLVGTPVAGFAARGHAWSRTQTDGRRCRWPSPRRTRRRRPAVAARRDARVARVAARAARRRARCASAPLRGHVVRDVDRARRAEQLHERERELANHLGRVRDRVAMYVPADRGLTRAKNAICDEHELHPNWSSTPAANAAERPRGRRGRGGVAAAAASAPRGEEPPTYAPPAHARARRRGKLERRGPAVAARAHGDEQVERDHERRGIAHSFGMPYRRAELVATSRRTSRTEQHAAQRAPSAAARTARAARSRGDIDSSSSSPPARRRRRRRRHPPAAAPPPSAAARARARGRGAPSWHGDVRGHFR